MSEILNQLQNEIKTFQARVREEKTRELRAKLKAHIDYARARKAYLKLESWEQLEDEKRKEYLHDVEEYNAVSAEKKLTEAPPYFKGNEEEVAKESIEKLKSITVEADKKPEEENG